MFDYVRKIQREIQINENYLKFKHFQTLYCEKINKIGERIKKDFIELAHVFFFFFII